MTCSTCGNLVAQDARFCPRCGAAAVLPGQAETAYAAYGMIPYDRVRRHIQALGVLWLVYGGLRLVTGLVGVLVFHGLLGNHFRHSGFDSGWSPFGRMWMETLLPIAFFWVVLGVVCTLLTGYALMTRQPWGRILAIVFGIFALFHPFLGTALGIYTLWVLAPRLSGNEYAAMAYNHNGA